MNNEQSILYPHTKPVFVKSFDLIVRDLDLVSKYYQAVIGLQKLEGGNKGHILGAGEKPLLTLHKDQNAEQAPPRSAGLYHTAFLLPSRKDLAHYLRHIAEHRITIVGAADHLVSEALYLSDPEGNGIEIYADRPHEEWSFDEDGVVMDTIALKADELLSIAPTSPWHKLPDDTAIGHIHLQVGNIPQAEKFYADVMGLDIMERFPGGSFFASGDYHHHLATNIWNSRNALPRQKHMSGLQGYTLKVNDEKKLQSVLASIEALEIPITNTPTGKFIHDPWGIGITLT